MANTKYAFQGYDEKNMAKALGRGLGISTKKSVEVCNWIKGKKVSRAKKMLEEVIDLKTAVPYKRFNQELAHQKATGPGGYPVSVCKEILALVKSAEANASSKGLNTTELFIVHACAHLASRPFRFGRQRRIKAKRSHVEIIVKESASAKKAKETKKVAAEKKVETKKESKPVTTKKEEVDTKKAETKKESKPAKSSEKSEEKKDDTQ